MPAELRAAPSLHAAIEHAAVSVKAIAAGRSAEPVQVLLPGVESILQWQRRLGGHAGVRAQQFYGLASAILDRAAVPVGRLNGDGAAALTRHLLTRMSDDGELTTFAPVAGTPGFARELLEWVREMRTQEIAADQLEAEAARTGRARDAQLARLYRRYRAFLDEHRLQDADGLLALAADALSDDPRLLSSTPLLLVLGFDHFSPVQRRLLEAAAGSIERVVIYLTWDERRPADSRALSRLARTREALLAFARPGGASVPEPPGLPDGLRRVRDGLFEPATGIVPPADGGATWRAIAAPSREAEVRRALAEIKGLLLHGVRPDGVALLAPHPERYQACVTSTAREYGVPLSADRRLGDSPFIQALLNLLRLPPDFPRRETFDALRSPYLGASPLTPEQVSQLDRLTRERVVVAGVDQWRRALRPPPARPQGLEDEDQVHRPFYATLPVENLAAIEAGLMGFFAALIPDEAATVSDYALWVQERLLGLAAPADDADAEEAEAEPVSGLLAPGPAATPEDWEAFRQVPAVLGGLVDEAALLGKHDRPVTWDGFLRGLAERLPEAKWVPDTPIAGVRFGPLEAGRAVATEHLFVLGLSEGEFPSTPTPDPFYHAEERQAHPLPLRRPYPQDEACLWWQVLGAAQRSVTLLRPRFDERAAPWPPSPYWEAVLECAPGLKWKVEEPPIAALPTVSAAASPGELLTALTVAGRGGYPEEMEAARRNLEAAREVLARRSAWGPLGPFEGVLGDVGVTAELAERYGERHRWSVSRLNRYGRCPFSFFAAEVLKLEAVPDPQAGLDALVRGSLLHELLEHLFRRGVAQGLTLTAAQEEAWLACLADCAPEVLARAPQAYGFLSGPLWRHEREELVRLVGTLVAHECQENGDSCRYRPYRQELAFGQPGGDLPALEIEGPDGTRLQLRGLIDRVDIDAGGGLRIIDYKSGSTRFGLADIRAGRALQTALYALAAERLLPDAHVVESCFLHLPTRKTSGEVQPSAGVDEDEVIQAAVAAVTSFAAGARAGWFPLAGDQKGCAYCAAAALCRKDRRAHAKAGQASRR